MSKHSISISLSDIMGLSDWATGRRGEMQQSEMAKEKAYTDYLGTENQAKQQAMDQSASAEADRNAVRGKQHVYDTLVAGHQFGTDHPMFQETLASNPIAQKLNIAKYQTLGADNPYGLPEGTWLALDANGNPISQKTQTYANPGAAAPVEMQPTRGVDPRTGQATPVAPKDVFHLTPDQRKEFMLEHLTGGKQDMSVGANQTKKISHPGTGLPDETMQGPQTAYDRYLLSLTRAQQQDPVIKEITSTLHTFARDPVGQGLTDDGNAIGMAAVTSLPELRQEFPKLKPTDLAAIAIRRAQDSVRANQKAPPNPADALKAALGEGETPAAPAAPKPPTTSLVERLDAAPGKATEAAMAKKQATDAARVKTFAEKAQPYFAEEYQNMKTAGYKGADAVERAIDRTLLHPNVQHLVTPEQRGALRDALKKAVTTIPGQPQVAPGAAAAGAPTQVPQSAKGGSVKTPSPVGVPGASSRPMGYARGGPSAGYGLRVRQ